MDKIKEALQAKNLQGDIYRAKTHSYSLSFENSIFKSFESKNTYGYGVRVLDSFSKEGFSSSNEDDPSVVDKALSLASFGEKVNYEFPHKAPLKQMPFLYDPSIENLKDEELIQKGFLLLDALKNRFKDYQYSLDFNYGYSDYRLYNTNHFDESYKESYFGCSISAVRAKEQQIIQIGNSLFKRGMPGSFDVLLNKLFRELELLELPLKVLESGFYPVILSPKAMKSFINIVTTGFNGKLIQQGISPIIDKIGKVVAPSFFNISADGCHEDLLSTAPFDDEGIPSQTLPLINKGVCAEGIYDLKTASKMNKKSTSNGLRSTTSLPSLGFRNIIVEAGSQPIAEMIKGISKGVYVHDLVGSGMSNTLEGEFSANIGLGYFIEQGKFSSQVKNTMINGNVFDMLSSLQELSLEVESNFSYILPYGLLDRIKIVS